MKQETFLGVVNRRQDIYIPWRGTVIPTHQEYETGQNLIVTLEINEVGNAKMVKAELPTLSQLKAMKDEFDSDWERLSSIFHSLDMGRKVHVLYALDRAIKTSEDILQ